jgi:predicted nucleic acid-binding protein
LKTAVDSSVLLDVFAADPTFGNASREALRRAYDSGAIVACEIVWSEVRANFPQDDAFREAMGLLGIRFDPATLEAAEHAGRLWREYRRRGAPKKRIVPDFLVGAHAFHQADALLSRDRGFYRRYFTNLSIVDPSTGTKTKDR